MRPIVRNASAFPPVTPTHGRDDLVACAKAAKVAFEIVSVEPANEIPLRAAVAHKRRLWWDLDRAPDWHFLVKGANGEEAVVRVHDAYETYKRNDEAMFRTAQDLMPGWGLIAGWKQMHRTSTTRRSSLTSMRHVFSPLLKQAILGGAVVTGGVASMAAAAGVVAWTVLGLAKNYQDAVRQVSQAGTAITETRPFEVTVVATNHIYSWLGNRVVPDVSPTDR